MKARLFATTALAAALAWPAVGALAQASGSQQEPPAGSQPGQSPKQGRSQQQLDQAASRVNAVHDQLRQAQRQGGDEMSQALDAARPAAEQAIEATRQALQQAQKEQTGDLAQQAIRNARQEADAAKQALQQASQENAPALVQAFDDLRLSLEEVKSGAQRADTAGEPPARDSVLPAERASELIGKSARGTSGEDLGKISEVVIGPDGTAQAVVIDVGGFLGLADRPVAVDWRKLQVSRNPDEVTVRMTREELAAAPDYQPDQPQGDQSRQR